MQAQNRYSRALGYLTWTTRWAPGRAELNDGQRVAANLSRTQFNLGLGFGSLNSFALFGGANMDMVTLSNPVAAPIENFNTGLSGQTYLFIGMSLYDIQITYASMQNLVNENALKRDLWGNFQATTSSGNSNTVATRSGTPKYLSNNSDGSAWLYDVLSIYENRTGAFLALGFADTPQSHETTDEFGQKRVEYSTPTRKLNEFRLNIQPLKSIPQSVLNTVGLPSLGLRRLSAYRDYYQDRINDVKSLSTGALGSVPRSDSLSYPYEIDVGSDDAFGLGIRWRVVTQVSPNQQFQRAELGFVDEFPWNQGAFRVGSRFVAYSARDTINVAFDSYVLFAPIRSMRESGLLAAPFSMGLSYSFNSPDTTTFLPIENAHVMGVQLILGYPETARPLIPLVRSADGRRGGNRQTEAAKGSMSQATPETKQYSAKQGENP